VAIQSSFGDSSSDAARLAYAQRCALTKNRRNIMQDKLDQPSSNFGSDESKVDSAGNSFKPRVERKDRWRTLSSRAKVVIISIATSVALLAALLTNILLPSSPHFANLKHSTCKCLNVLQE